MSLLHDYIGGMLNVLVDVPRAMTRTEAYEFMRTGIFPNLSVPPPEDVSAESQRALSDTNARLQL